jgi:hypothetical protein
MRCCFQAINSLPEAQRLGSSEIAALHLLLRSWVSRKLQPQAASAFRAWHERLTSFLLQEEDRVWANDKSTNKRRDGALLTSSSVNWA